MKIQLQIQSILFSLILFALNANAWTNLNGVNLSGAEFGSNVPSAKQGTTYIWHTPSDLVRLHDYGFNTVRLPFLWERMQPELSGPISESEAKYLDALVIKAQSLNMVVIIDPHNFGKYKGELIGGGIVGKRDFGDFWRKMAERYKNYNNVMYGLMNEPNKQTAVEWAQIVQEAITAIRRTGARQRILIPGTNWTAANSWTSGSANNISNAQALSTIKDPMNNFAFEMHQYFDTYTTGTLPTCVSETIGVERLTQATAWLKKNNFKGFLGEFGVANNPTCLAALNNTLQYLESNNQQWIGWTYWSASRWTPKYMFDVYSLDPVKQPQTGVIKDFLR